MSTAIIRVVLDYEDEDVIRDVAIPVESDLEELHHLILQAFQLREGELGAFYQTGPNWEMGEEIPLVNMNSKDDCMRDFTVGDFFHQPGDRLLYIYDFLSMWTFFCELKEYSGRFEASEKKVVSQSGTRPQEAPPKIMTSQSSFDQYDDLLDFGDEKRN